MKKNWVVAMVAHMANSTAINGRVTSALIEAANEDEATGKALRLCRRTFPPDAGYVRHYVVVNEAVVTDVDRTVPAEINT